MKGPWDLWIRIPKSEAEKKTVQPLTNADMCALPSLGHRREPQGCIGIPAHFSGYFNLETGNPKRATQFWCTINPLCSS